MNAADRFWAKVDASGDCWLWLGSVHRTGYGSFWSPDEQRVVGAHRFAYELLVGPIPEGLQIDHLCRVRRCVNPDHLEPVTERVNILRGASPSAQAARRVLCKAGHPLDDREVTRLQAGRRLCRPCNREAVARYRRRGRRIAGAAA